MARTGADPYVPGHGDRRWSALGYDLDLDYKVATNHLSGTAVIRARLLSPTSEVTLDLFGLRASRVLVDGRKAKSFSQSAGRLRVGFPAGLPLGHEFTLTIRYAGKPRPMPGPDGSAGWEELTDGVLVGSQPHGAPTWYPCNDRPDDKAPYRISLSVEAGYHVAGNGVRTDTVTRSGRTRWTHDQAEPMAPYLACVQIGRYAVTHVAASVPVEIVAPLGVAVGAGTAFAHQGEMVDVLSQWFGPYPFATYRAVIAADDFEIPLEAQGLSSFGRNHLTPSWENERLVVHELAHSWFGNSLTAGRWSDIWLHEGFACHAEWLWSEHRGLRSAADHAAEHWGRLSRLPQDLVLAAPGMDHMFDDRVYKRGALALHALRGALGDEGFFALLRSWTATHEHALVSTEDFVSHAEAAAGSSAGKVRALLDGWLSARALPPL